MVDKTVLLTGATSGIGQAAAIELAQRGYRLFLVARSKAKAEITDTLIKNKAPNADIDWLFGDLASLDEVREIANQFLASGSQLDVLFNNAGVTTNGRQESEDGYEMMFAVNHLAPFLLTNLLFDKLCEGSHETRVVSTSSGAHNFVKTFNIHDPNWTKEFKLFPAYGNSKLANILFTQSLAEKLQAAAPQKQFAVNSYHPGFVGTNLGTDTTLGKVIMTLIRPFARSGKKGAETGIYLITDPALKGSSAGYYFNCEKQRLKPYACDSVMADALWQKSLLLTGLAER